MVELKMPGQSMAEKNRSEQTMPGPKILGPKKFGRRKILLGLVVAANLLFLLLCGHFLAWQPSADHELKMQAAVKAAAAQQVIGPRLLGEEYTPITTTLGAEAAKKISAHPDFAAVAVQWLTEAGVRPGDKVAVNMSGSFPALNIAVLSALTVMDAQPVLVSSVGASTWGANRPDYTWLDMEKDLVAAKIWPWRSQAVSLGGGSDQGRGLTPEGLSLLKQAALRSGVDYLGSTSLPDAVAKRLAVYREAGGGALPAVLVNVGGSQVIFGGLGHGAPLKQGVTSGYTPSLAHNNGIAAAFINTGRPVLHFINIQRLAAIYDIKPESAVGSSRVYYDRILPPGWRWLIAAWLAGMVIFLHYGSTREWWRW